MSDVKRQFTGVFIPANIWLSQELIPSEKMLLGEIDALSKESGWCYASRKHFCEWLQCSLPNVSYYVEKLERLGFLEVDRKPGERSKMRVVNSRFYEKRQVVNGTDGVVNGTDGVVNGTDPKYKYIDKNKNKKKEKLAPQAAFITTHTPTEFENVRIVEGQTFDLEEKTNLEPITPAARELSDMEAQSADEARQVFAAIAGKKPREHDSQLLQDFSNMGTNAEFEAVKRRMTAKPRPHKPAGNSTDPTAETIAYLNEKAGTSFRTNSKATKAQINARAKEGYTVEDFKAVIDFKTAEWGTDAKMMQYLCPETLFRASKFEGYLQAAKRAGNIVSDTNVARYSLEDRPVAKTPEEMKVELSKFYNAHKSEALLDQVQRFAETNYTPERLRSIVIDFCGNQVAKRREGETFGQHHAALGLWLKRQKEFEAAKSPATTQHTAGPQPQAPLRSAAPVNYSPQGPQLRSEQKAE